MTSLRTSRRRFLKGAAAALGMPWIVPPSVLGAEPPSERVVMGCIGVGPRGRLNLRGLMTRGAQIVAVCDVNEATRQAAVKEVQEYYKCSAVAETYKGCAAYNDFRELVARDDIQAVMIATPDHWHVPIAIAAVRSGKDVYVEKPLGISIDEGKALRKAVRQYGAVFMHGTEQRCMRQFRFGCELVRNGRIGTLHTVKVACPGGRAGGVHPPQPVPKGFDYEMWLGPARWMPYSPARVAAGSWYFISDYAASGFVAGWGVHHIDMAQWGIGADHTGPVEIRGSAVFPPDGIFDTPVTWDVDYLYANGVRVSFTDNSKNRQGVRFEGTKGWVHINRNSIDAEPKALLTSKIRPNEIHLYQATNDDRNFVECVKSRAETASPIEVAHRSTSVCYLGHIAMLLRRTLRWDPQKEQFVGDPAADRYLSRPMRAPWHL